MKANVFPKYSLKLKFIIFFLSKKLVLGVMVKINLYFDRGKTN